MKRILALLFALLLPLIGLAESIEAAATYEPLPLGGAAPYAPIASAFTEDGMGYDDGTMSVRIETDVQYGTNIYYVWVKITDPSQLRTATAGKPKSKTKKPVAIMAEANNAVLAINGDFYAYHSDGVVYRSGELVRMNPRNGRDAMIFDENGDVNLITWTGRAGYDIMRASFDNFEGEIREAFTFGPALIIDGVVQEFDYKKKTSCGYPTPAQRLAFCQIDELSYLIIATEGPEQDKKAGLSVPQLTELCVAHGAQQAYNLDGGSSVTIILGDRRINAPQSKDRDVGDIIYFATLRAE